VSNESAVRVVYVATGEQYIREAAASLKSLWRHNAGVPVTMYVDSVSRASRVQLDVPSPPREDLLEILRHPDPRYSWSDKPIALSQVPYERVLYLDTDTRICGSVMEIFDLLTVFDLAAAHAPIRLDPRQPPAFAKQIPAAFPELNTGVVAFRLTTAVADFLEEWRHIHLDLVQSTDQANVGDQAAFRVALFNSRLRFSVLTPEYNCRFPFPTYVYGPVRILHGRSHDLERIEGKMNKISGPRVFVPGVGILRIMPWLLWFQRRYQSWREQGTLRILRKGLGRFLNPHRKASTSDSVS
jgi:hypothetical protein